MMVSGTASRTPQRDYKVGAAPLARIRLEKRVTGSRDITILVADYDSESRDEGTQRARSTQRYLWFSGEPSTRGSARPADRRGGGDRPVTPQEQQVGDYLTELGIGVERHTH